jgi:hypothetical protein
LDDLDNLSWDDLDIDDEVEFWEVDINVRKS